VAVAWCGCVVVSAGSILGQSDTVIRSAPAARVADAPATIGPAEAAAHAGQECVVEMTVRSTRHLAEKEMCFLNSAKRHRDEDNFTVVIFTTGLARLREAGIDQPAERYRDRTIRVRGVVQLRNERPQIVVESPTQIELVADPAADN
jgi:hypothetical protein